MFLNNNSATTPEGNQNVFASFLKRGLFMPPTSKKLEGHIVSWSFIHPVVLLFDALHNFRNMHATVLKFLI